MDIRLWGLVIRPLLSDRSGWAIFIGTFKGQNHLYTIYKFAMEEMLRGAADWFGSIFRASETNIIPKEELASLRNDMEESEYMQEFECSHTAALKGAYWGKQIEEARSEGRISKVPHDPALLVDTFWDLGINDTTTIWFVQQYRMEVRVIDCYEMSGMGLDHYARLLKGQVRGSEHMGKYSYREHNWPHDGGSRDLSSGKERSTTMRELGIRVTVRPKYDIADSINAVRLLIPKCYFDEESCSKGITALENYQRAWDSKNQIFQDKPLHNWASHFSDAARLLAMCLKPGEDRMDKRKLPRTAESSWNIFGRNS
jgi:hypothetical protein